ncbi:hypothetical protein QF018_005758 [Pseudomonas laurylsulfatiphila]
MQRRYRPTHRHCWQASSYSGFLVSLAFVHADNPL